MKQRIISWSYRQTCTIYSIDQTVKEIQNLLSLGGSGLRTSRYLVVVSTLWKSNMDVPEVDETIKRIQGHKGVQGVIISNKEGVPLKTTMDNTSTIMYVTGLTSIEERACSMVRDFDPSDALLFMRIRSKKYEIMAAIEDDYTVMVIQNPHEP